MMWLVEPLIRETLTLWFFSIIYSAPAGTSVKPVQIPFRTKVQCEAARESFLERPGAKATTCYPISITTPELSKETSFDADHAHS
jgi:hypothetical protein